jgi:hypothetical protein
MSSPPTAAYAQPGKPAYVTVVLNRKAGGRPVLVVSYATGDPVKYRISNAVAEVLIAHGMPYGE